MDIISILNDMITSGLGLSLVGGSFLLWWLSGRIPNLFTEKEWSWKRGLEDLCKAVLMGVILVAGTGLLNLGGQFFSMIGWDITQGTETVSTYVLAGAMAYGFGLYMSRAINNAVKFFRLKTGKLKGDKEQFDNGIAQIGEGTRNLIGQMVALYTQHDQTGEAGKVVKTTKQINVLKEMGAWPWVKVDISTPEKAYKNLDGRGFNEGFGDQCVAGFKEFQYCLSGQIVAAGGAAANYASEPAITNVCKLGFTWHNGSEGLQNGDWGVWTNGTYGHISMYYNGKWFGQNQGAANPNLGNPFNLSSLSMNGFAGYYRPNIYTVIPEKSDTAPLAPSARPVTYVYRQGDTFGQVIKDLGLATTHGLWGENGDVAYYTDQLHDQGIWGNIPVGTTIKLTPRV